MYAIVEIAGKQYKVRENDKLIVPRLSGEVDDTVTFDRVLLIGDDGEEVKLGTPLVADASVTATIVEHVKGDKVLVFRKKRRKRFKVKRGHRQPYTRIEVSDLSVDGKQEKKASKKKKSEAKPKADAQAESAKAASQSAESHADAAEAKAAAAQTQAKEAPAEKDKAEDSSEKAS